MNPTTSPRVARFRRLLPLAALLGSLAAAAPASAAVTTSNVTTPPDKTFFQTTRSNSTYDSNPDVAIAGTSNGVAGDVVDVVCTTPGNDLLIADNVAVNADGTFSVTVPATSFSDTVCVLRALPDDTGYSSSDAARYTGPRVGRGEFQKYSSSGIFDDFYLAAETFGAETEFEPVGRCGISDSELRTPNLSTHTSFFSCDGALYPNDDLDHNGQFQIDGHTAYTAYDTRYLGYYAAPCCGGYERYAGKPTPTLTESQDPSTGDVTFTETEPTVFCVDASGNPMPETGQYTYYRSCDHLAPTGVTLTRTSTQSDAGLTIAQRDSYTSTTGSHALRLRYDDSFNCNNCDSFGTQLPGESGYQHHVYGDEVALPATAPATVYIKQNRDTSAGYDNVVGAITYDTAPTVARFGDPNDFTLTYERTVTGDTPVVIGQTYRESSSEATLRAATQTSSPVLTITSPANGAVTTHDTIPVTGTVTDESTVTSLRVNGEPTTVNPDGSWTQIVPLSPGRNTITAVATDQAGKSSTVSVAVTYTPPEGSCVVPKVAGKTVAAATAALEAAGCTAGNGTLALSRTVAPGLVISQDQLAGKRVSRFYPVGLVVSAGRPHRVKLAHRTVRLVGRTLTIQLACPVDIGKACNGTAKIRTVSGRRSTLGTRAFQTPAGKRRKVVFTLSKAAAARIHKAHGAKARVFIVSRDEAGNSSVVTPRLTIKG